MLSHLEFELRTALRNAENLARIGCYRLAKKESVKALALAAELGKLRNENK